MSVSLSFDRLFAQQAADIPHAIAIQTENLALTYGALNARVYELAGRLKKLGVGPERAVGLLLPRGPELAIGLLAVLRVGGVCLPLDRQHPTRLLHQVIDDARPVVLIVHAPTQKLATLLARRIPICDMGDVGAWSEESSGLSDPAPEPDLSHLSFLLYTSGSTGPPKGVMMTGGRFRRQHWTSERYAIGREARHLVKSPIGFGTLIRELFWPLTTGGVAIIASPNEHRDGDALWQRMIEERVTVANLGPTWLADLLEPAVEDSGNNREMEDGGRRNLAWHGPRHLFCTGEALDRSLRSRCAERLPGTTLHVFYGSTEIPTATAWDVEPRDAIEAIILGRETDVEIWIVDRQLRAAEDGNTGEIVIRTEDLARGYHRSPALTASRFVPDPFPGAKGQRLFRTGDLGRRLPDGRLEYRGRAAHRLKRRGVSIEPFEVEQAISGHPDVLRSAAVLADGRLVVFYQARRELSTDALRKHAALELPPERLPDDLRQLPSLPRLVHGKIDRQALQQLANRPIRGQGGAPRGEIEARIAEHWRDLLKVGNVGRGDLFFALGGHSLIAQRLATRLRSVWPEIDAAMILRFPTVRQLARKIADDPRHRSTEMPASELPSGTVAMPLSAAQRRLWFLSRIHPESPAYTVATAIELQGPLKIESFERAWIAILDRHEPLRTGILEQHGEPVPWLDDLTSAAVHTVDRSAIDLSAIDLSAINLSPKRLTRLSLQLARRPLDPGRPPLIRGVLLKLTANRWRFLALAHHLAFDGRSRRPLLRDLAELYAAQIARRQPNLPVLRRTYADFALREQRFLKSDAAKTAIEQWRQIFDEVPEPLFSTDKDASVDAARFGQATSVVRRLDGAMLARLRSIADSTGCTLFTVFLSAYALLLARLADREDFTIGLPVDRRDDASSELIGCFINLLPLRLRYRPGQTFSNFLRDVWQGFLALMEGSEIPFDRLVEALNPPRQARHQPLCNVAINFLPDEPWQSERSTDLDPPPEHPTVAFRRLELPPTGARFDLDLFLARDLLTRDLDRDQSSGWRVKLVTRRALFAAERATAILEQYVELLHQIADDPAGPLKHFSLLTPRFAEQLRQLETPPAPTDRPPLHWLVRQQMAEAPDRVALRQGGSSGSSERTYGQFFLDVDAVARSWSEQGLESGDRVAILCEPDLAQIGAILAALDLGTTVLLIDSALPPKRRLEILEQAMPRWCLDVESARNSPTPLEPPRLEPLRSKAEKDQPDDAFLFFTSGSTGRPKGLVFSHRSVVHFLDWERQHLKIDEHDRVALLTAPAFDAVLRDLFLPLTSGGTLVIPPATKTPGAASRPILPWLAEERITIVHAVPSVARSWMASLWRPITLHGIRATLFSGEPLNVALVRLWRSFCPNGRILNLYGTTETVLCKCFHEISKATSETSSEATQNIIPIGRPLPGVRAKIVDSEGRNRGVGELGEIILEPPFEARPLDTPRSGNAPLGQTGDLGRYLPDGTITLVGRRDRQLKIRGVRIEPAEIEGALLTVPGMVESAMVPATDAHGDPKLIAYLVMEEGAPEVSDLSELMRQRLPGTMVPATFVTLEQLPRSATGKVDYRSLPHPARDHLKEVADHSEPGDPLELQLTRLWEELLGIEGLGIDDNFFDLGGHSLTLLQLTARIEEIWGARLLPEVLLPTASIRHAARVLRRQNSTRRRSSSRLVTLQPGTDRPPLFCLHPAGGSVLCYVQLARGLGADQPVYGLRGPDPRRTDAREDAPTIQALASRYADEVARAQADGPILLAGYSFGGLVAFEMGHEFTRRGRQVALLALLDTHAPTPSKVAGQAPDHDFLNAVATILEKYDLDVEALDRDAERALWDDFRRLARRYEEQTQNFGQGRMFGNIEDLLRSLQLFPEKEGLKYADIHRYMRILRVHFRAARAYRAEPSHHRLSLFQSTERLSPGSLDPEDRTASWHHFAAQGIDVHRVPGNHLTLLSQPAVETLAKTLRQEIDRSLLRSNP